MGFFGFVCYTLPYDEIAGGSGRASADAAAAERVIDQMRTSMQMLGEWPRVGHDGIVPGTYDKTVPRAVRDRLPD
jgi:hypothetical protein